MQPRYLGLDHERPPLGPAVRHRPLDALPARDRVIAVDDFAFDAEGLAAIDDVLDLDLKKNGFFGFGCQFVNALLQLAHFLRIVRRDILRFGRILRKVVELNPFWQHLVPN